MQRLLFIAILLLFTAPVSAQTVEPVDNTHCIALNDPYPCCQEFEAGSCDNKAKWVPVKLRHQYTEFCASYWYEDTCASTRLGDLFDEGVCTQQEIDAGDPLPIVTCTETRATNGWCRGDLGCTEVGAPWGCCTGLDTGTCPFGGSVNTPESAGCRKTWHHEMVRLWKAQRGSGQRQWKAQDDPAFVADDSDVD